MIPPDVASNLRPVLAELNARTDRNQTQPVASTQRITDVLKDAVPGQRILAEIQALLPNGTYRAVVAQRELTLALPFSAKAGDSLELEVVDNDGQLGLAVVANRGQPAGNTPTSAASVSTSLSAAGKLIGNLLTDIDQEGSRPPALPLKENQPLMTGAPLNAGADLAPILKQALTQSGMFYEAHQARWVAGKLNTATLLQEPQGKFSTASTATPLGSTATPASVFQTVSVSLNSVAAPTTVSAPISGLALASEDISVRPPAPAPLANSTEPITVDRAIPTNTPVEGSDGLAASNEAITRQQKGLASAYSTSLEGEIGDFLALVKAEENSAGTVASSTAKSPLPPGHTPAPAPADTAPPETGRNSASGSQENTLVARQGPAIQAELAPIVQQQLNALATQTYVWQGQVWPGQTMHWEITEDGTRQSAPNEMESGHWQTRLKLNLPTLGGIEATLRLDAAGALDLSLISESPESTKAFRAASRELASSMQAAGLNLAGFMVSHGENNN